MSGSHFVNTIDLEMAAVFYTGLFIMVWPDASKCQAGQIPALLAAMHIPDNIRNLDWPWTMELHRKMKEAVLSWCSSFFSFVRLHPSF